MAIYQGDQYSLPFTIKKSGEIVTPEEVEDVTIALEDIVRSYKDETLKYEDGTWLFPLTKEETSRMMDNTKCQIEVVFGNDMVHSKVFDVKVKKSLRHFVKR